MCHTCLWAALAGISHHDYVYQCAPGHYVCLPVLIVGLFPEQVDTRIQGLGAVRPQGKVAPWWALLFLVGIQQRRLARLPSEIGWRWGRDQRPFVLSSLWWRGAKGH